MADQPSSCTFQKHSFRTPLIAFSGLSSPESADLSSQSRYCELLPFENPQSLSASLSYLAITSPVSTIAHADSALI